MEFIIKREAEHKYFENSQTGHVRNKSILGMKTKGVAK
jgi:hypothetical protein